MPELNEYKKDLEELAQKASTDFINNSSTDHAMAMIEGLFNHAKGKVRILTDSLTPAAYDRPEVMESVKKFMDEQGSEIDCILQFNKDNEDHVLSTNPFIKFLNRFGEKVKLYKANEKSLKDFDKHFMVLNTDQGKYAFRLEMDIDKHLATGSFNAEKEGKTLCEFFDGFITNGGATKIAQQVG